MIRSFVAAAGGLLSVLLLLSSSAFGHGFTLSQVNGQLVLDTQGSVRPFRVGYVPTFDPNTNQPIINDSGNPLTFAHELDLSNSMNHGAIGLVANNADQLDLTDTYRLEFAGPLWYSNGGAATPAVTNLTAQSFAAGNVPLDSHVVSGNSPGSTISLSAHSAHSTVWTLGAGAPDGVYGLSYRVLWDDAGAPAEYQSSNWVDLLFITPNFLGSTNLLAAEQSVVAAAVPEPSALALGCLGLAALGVRLWRKR